MNLKKKPEIMVSVIVCTYMRERYIRQSLDAILAQRTTYPFEVIVGENHGADNTLQILREYEAKYSNIKVLAHKENIGPHANWDSCFRVATGKYIMDCCDDDWWHNPNKIQLQVDFMEQHPECVMCHTDYDVYNEKTGKTIQAHNSSAGRVILEGMVQKEMFSGKIPVGFLTDCYRREVYVQHIPLDRYMEIGIVGGDFANWVILSAYGEIRYLPISTATYREGNSSETRAIDYDRVIYRREADKRMFHMLYEVCPQLGTYNEDEYFNDYYSHQLLMAAYRNNDYAAAKKYAKEDKMPNWRTRMARTWLTFQIARMLKR